MSAAANAARGEAALDIGGEVLTLRPSFAALVAAEEELGPLFELVERTADGKLSLGDLAALFWHCLTDRRGGLMPNRSRRRWSLEARR
ncbi:MAG: gene transfer agent family protein [Sphingobium sp.]